MKASKKTFLALVLTVLLALTAWAGQLFTLPASVQAGAVSEYSYDISKFDVEMNVTAERVIEVKEVITVSFSGWDSHGIIRDLPLGNGVTYANFTATCNSDDFYYYSQDDDSSFFSVYLRGDQVVTGQRRTYTLTYTMSVSSLADKGYLPLDVIGYGWQTEHGIKNITVKVTVPDGVEEYTVYSGSKGSSSNNYAECKKNGDTFVITAEDLPSYAGITLDLHFAKGVLTTPMPVLTYSLVGISVVLLVVGVILKTLFVRNPIMTKTVNLSAPEEMDPLRMGKIIDDMVDQEDIGALVFWLADQGYITIDLSEGEDDPILRKTSKPLPENAEKWQKQMYRGLFRSSNSVRISDLEDKFYTTVEKIKLSVRSVEEGLYKASPLPFVFALASMAIFALILFVKSDMVMADYRYLPGVVGVVIAVIAGFISSFNQVRLQFKASKFTQMMLIFAPIAIVAVVAFLFFTIAPSAAYTMDVPFVACVGGVACGVLAGQMFVRTKEYTAVLGQILGFKDFITYTEKDKIGFMLQENPELYYHILPYAQVLGVTDAWSDKFKGLSMQPPSYMYYGRNDMIFDYMIWHHTFRALNSSLSSAMVSRPSSSGGGSVGGGFGGGGFGGGGGRGC